MRLHRAILVAVGLAAIFPSAGPMPTRLVAQAAIDETLPCFQPVTEVRWMPWEDNRSAQDLWCKSVGKPLFQRRFDQFGDTTGLVIVSWNMHVGGGRVEDLLQRMLGEASQKRMDLVVLIQEAFRAGEAVPASYPPTLNVPRSIRPRRPAMDIATIAAKFNLSVAYVPSMRNGSATRVDEREDRGNAILTTMFMNGVSAVELPFGKQRRVAVAANVRSMNGPPIRVVSAHFDSGDHRVYQAVGLGERILFLQDFSVVVGADTNARRGVHDGAVLALSNRVPLTSCGTGGTMRWPLRLDVLVPAGRPDFMFVMRIMRNLNVQSCETLRDAYGSDHVPLVLTIQY